MRFESAQFKLSHEMTQLLDPPGTMKSETWTQFVRHVILYFKCSDIVTFHGYEYFCLLASSSILT